MIIKTAIIFRRLSRATFVIGWLCLILGLVLSFLNVPASASTDSTGILDRVPDYQPNVCTSGFKCEPPGCNPDPYSSWDAPAGYLICMIVVKAGSHYLSFSSDGCADVNGDGQADYCVSGVGTGTGRAERQCDENGQEWCYEISFSEYYIDDLPPLPTPTETDVAPPQTPTNTSLPATSTPTSTNTPVPPTETQTGTPTNTSTPTGTPIAATTTPTATGTQPTATMTDTPVPSTATPTSTSTSTQLATTTGISTNTVTSTSSPTSTSTSALTATQTQPPTMPPPSHITTTPVLIPVTGADLSGVGNQVSVYAKFLINFGIGVIGLALVFLGLGKRLESL